MAESPDRVVVALARERRMCLQAGDAARVLPIDEQLAQRGWCVNDDDELVKLDEKRNAKHAAKEQAAPEHTAAEKPPESAVPPKPKQQPRGKTGSGSESSSGDSAA